MAEEAQQEEKPQEEKQEEKKEEKKKEAVVGLYICTGCDIDSLDIDKLKEVGEEEKVPVVRTHPNLCGKEGVELINKDIKEQGVNAITIAACSSRVKWDIFDFPECTVDRTNLREGVVWSHELDEHAQELAEDYVRMGVSRAKRMKLPTPWIEEEIDRSVLVAGGGISGLTAALEAAKAGSKVHLVEKTESLGGWAAKYSKVTPQKHPYQQIEDFDIGEMINEVNENSNIDVYTSTKIESITGQPGQFDVKLNHGGSEVEFKTGAIVLATGWKPYDATKLEHLGYGKDPNVITNVEMEEQMSNGGVSADSVAFIQCAGQRDENHLPYCSSVCCAVSLKQAKYIRESNPDSKVYIIYRDMRTPGLYEDFYRTAQDDEGIFFTKGEVTGVNPENGSLAVEAKDTLLGENVKLKVDKVVLATGMVSSMADVPETREERAKLEKEGVEYENILHLGYRQGPDLPTLKYGFPDSNFVCFPYETRRSGIYTAGCVRQPMNIRETMDDAAGAALKAIQSIELVSQGASTFPRSGDIDYPQVFLQRCTQCKRCTEECPFGAINETEDGTPIYHYNRCRRCGTCFGACPERIISFNAYSVDMVAGQLKAVSVPDPDEEKPRMIAFVCENDALPALDMAAMNKLKYNSYIRVMPVRCLGSVNTVFIADTLSKGIDGILMLGCKYGENYQCHFIRGSELANERMEKVQETLDRLMLESERVQVHQVEITDYNKIPQIMNQFYEDIMELEPNPYKGF
ncbi:MAG: hydrogenase iron-sulfur subunit [Archaeoglobaceae archaeon]